MAPGIRFVVPINQIVYIGSTNNGKIVIYGYLKSFRRVTIAIHNLNTMQITLVDHFFVHWLQSGNSIRSLPIPIGVVPKQKSSLLVSSFYSLFSRPHIGQYIMFFCSSICPPLHFSNFFTQDFFFLIIFR